MLILKSLTFENIGRFVESQTIDFTSLGSLIQVDGENRNTGGSSGAGKSTIFKALEFLLGLNDISNGILQSRLTKEPMLVTGIFDLDGIPLRIERGKKLLIDLNGEITTGSSKLTEEKLDQIIGMPRDLFRKILHKRQGEGGFFLQMGPSDVYKFLTSCLNLDKEQSKILTLDARLDVLTKQEISLKSTLESNQMGLQATQNAISSLGLPPTLEVDPEALEGLKTRYVEAVDLHRLAKINYKKESDDLEKSRPIIQTMPFDRSKIETLENEIGTILAKITELEKVELERQSKVKSKISELQVLSNKLESVELTRRNDIKSQIYFLEIDLLKNQGLITRGNEAKEQALISAKELNKIRSSICPTCEQNWANDLSKSKESEILAKLSEHKKSIIAGNEALVKVDSINKRISQLKIEAQPKVLIEIQEINEQIAQLKVDSEPQAIPEAIELKMTTDFKRVSLASAREDERDHQLKENAKSQLILVEFSQKQTELRKIHEIAIKSVQDEENKALASLRDAEYKVKAFEEAKKKFEESFAKLKDQELRYAINLGSAELDLSRIQEEMELVVESKKAIKSYLSCSFEDALDSIGDMATRLIRAIPNMGTSTIQFEGLKETQQGKIKEEVNCLISMDGEIGIPVKSLSGGEKSSTDLAIDLAVIKFIEERTGKGIDLMILDEPFTGLDTANIVEALEMLKECSSDKRLIIVDHNAIASQFIENKITVIRDGLTSRVVQQ